MRAVGDFFFSHGLDLVEVTCETGAMVRTGWKGGHRVAAKLDDNGYWVAGKSETGITGLGMASFYTGGSFPALTTFGRKANFHDFRQTFGGPSKAVWAWASSPGC